MEIREVCAEDAAELAAIYAPYVLETVITFEITPPTVEEFRRRIEKIIEKGLPYLAAVENGEIIGYAYASPLHEREAFARSVETTVYVKKGFERRGIGRRLYAELEKRLVAWDARNAYACIVYPYPASVRFHEGFGYKIVGRFTDCGFKFGRRLDVVWMEKHF